MIAGAPNGPAKSMIERMNARAFVFRDLVSCQRIVETDDVNSITEVTHVRSDRSIGLGADEIVFDLRAIGHVEADAVADIPGDQVSNHGQVGARGKIG